MLPPQAAASPRPPAAAAAVRTSASPTTGLASRTSIVTIYLSPTSRQRKAAPDWASSCRTASCASTKVSCSTRAIAMEQFSPSCFRRIARNPLRPVAPRCPSVVEEYEGGQRQAISDLTYRRSAQHRPDLNVCWKSVVYCVPLLPSRYGLPSLLKFTSISKRSSEPVPRVTAYVVDPTSGA